MGLFLCVQTSREVSSLRNGIESMVEQTGRLTIGDPARVHVAEVTTPLVPRAIADEVLAVWQYQVYLPAGYTVQLANLQDLIAETGLRSQRRSGFSKFGVPLTEPDQRLWTIMLTANGDQVGFSIDAFGSSCSTMQMDANLADQWVIDELACPPGGTLSVGVDEPLMLVRVREPRVAGTLEEDSEVPLYNGYYQLMHDISVSGAVTAMQNGGSPQDPQIDQRMRRVE